MSMATTTTTTKRSPSPPPFSVAEFTSLVSAALDTDRFDPDPSQILSFNFIPTSSVPSSSSHDSRTSKKDGIMPHPCLPTPFSTLHLSMSTLDLNSESSSPAPSRPMALFQRIKRQATSAFVKNPQATATHTRLTHPTTTTVSFAPFPSYHPAPSIITTESRPSFFEDDSDSDEEDVLSDAGRTEESDYIPYIPLIIQHERSLQNHLALKPIGIYPLPRSPPSPTPSGSTTSTRSPVTPLTPVFSQNHHGPPPPPETQRWSLCNDDDLGEDAFSLSTSTDDADPFAKASVQIVRSSISSGSVYSLPSAWSKSWSPPKLSKSRKGRPAPLAPCKPPPLCPLPTLPNSQMLVESVSSSSENDSDSPPVPFSPPPPQSPSPITQLHIGRQTVDCSVHRRPREREGHYVQTIPTGVGKEWTLRLGVPSEQSPPSLPSVLPRVPTVRVTLSDTDTDKDAATTTRERRRVKSLPTRHRSVLSQFQTKSQGNLNLRREEEGEKDWTLSLPLSISLTRTLSFSRGELQLQEKKEGKERKGEQLGGGRRSRVTSLHPQARGRVASLLAPQQHFRKSWSPATRNASPTRADKQLGALFPPSRSVSPSPSAAGYVSSKQQLGALFPPSRSVSPSPSAAGYVSKDTPSPAAPRASAGASPLIIPPSALAARAKQGKGHGSLPPSSFAAHTGRSRVSLVSTSSSSSRVSLSSSRASLSSSRVSLGSSRVSPTNSSRVSPTSPSRTTYASVYHPPSTASSNTSTSSVGSATSTMSTTSTSSTMSTMSVGSTTSAVSTMSVESTASKMSVTSAKSTTSTSSSSTIVPARASITITRAGEDLEFPMPPTYAGGVDRGRSSPVPCRTASPRNSLTSARHSLTPPPSLDHNINGRLTPPSARGTTLTLPPPSSFARPSLSPSDSMWTDYDDETETETETETVYEDAVSILSGVYYSARSSFDF